MQNHPEKKKGIASNGEELHYSVGAVIERNGKYLMIDRKYPPFGFAGLAGHIDENETPETALIREIKEESNLDVVEHTLLFEEELLWNYCSSGPAHFWYLYRVIVEGDAKQNPEEEKSMGWYSADELAVLDLEPVWTYWFEKLTIIQKK